MERPVIGHRGPEMVGLIEDMQPGLSELFQTRRPVYLSTSSATGMMEAAITNLSRRRVLCLVNGAFSQRFYKIATACGRPADRLAVPFGEPNLPEALRAALTVDQGHYDLVTVVHSETSTGVLNPLAELSAVVHEFDDILLAVDAVTSLGGTPVRTDEWMLDFVLTGSQKALALPPGLALAVAGDRALQRADQVEARGYYFDLLDFERRIQKGQTPNTPVVPMFYALDFQLHRILAEGLETRWQRHAAMADRTTAWVDELTERTGRPFRVLAPPDYRSPTVTVIVLPKKLSGPAVASAIKQRGFTIATGYGELKPSAIRIGHMGDHTMDELERLLESLEEVLER
jgi:predicted phosphoserine aminotransferase